MDGFTFNKIAGAVLGAILVGFFIIEVSHMLYPNPRHGEHVEEMGYEVPGMARDGHGSTGEDHGTETPSVDLGTLLASADAAAGEAQFRACASCHNAAPGAGNKVGPNLWDVVGRGIGSVDGFGYSRALSDHGGDWTYEALFGFIANPREYIPGTSMSYPGMRRDGDRANLLAYLRTLSDNPVAFPSAAAAADAMHGVADDHMDEAMDAAADHMDDAMDTAEEHMDDTMDAAEEHMDDTMDAAEEHMDDAMDAATEGDSH